MVHGPRKLVLDHICITEKSKRNCIIYRHNCAILVALNISRRRNICAHCRDDTCRYTHYLNRLASSLLERHNSCQEDMSSNPRQNRTLKLGKLKVEEHGVRSSTCTQKSNNMSNHLPRKIERGGTPTPQQLETSLF
jgi:hypothetical protein